MTEESINKTDRNLLSEGILLALASAYVYLISYGYEFGYCMAFKLPTSFISPTPTTMLVAAFSVGILAALVFAVGIYSLPLLKGFFPKQSEEFYMTSALGISVLTLGIIDATLAGITTWPVIVGLAGGFGIYLSQIIMYFLPKREGASFFHRLKKATTADIDNSHSLLLMYAKFGHRRTLAVVVAFTFLVQSAFLGGIYGTSKGEFFMLADKENYALLCSYGDVLLTAKVDMDTHTLTGDYEVIKLSDKSDIKLKEVWLGSLKPKPTDTNAK